MVSSDWTMARPMETLTDSKSSHHWIPEQFAILCTFCAARSKSVLVQWVIIARNWFSDP